MATISSAVSPRQHLYACGRAIASCRLSRVGSRTRHSAAAACGRSRMTYSPNRCACRHDTGARCSPQATAPPIVVFSGTNLPTTFPNPRHYWLSRTSGAPKNVSWSDEASTRSGFTANLRVPLGKLRASDRARQAVAARCIAWSPQSSERLH
jgi:hypothetical protein